MSHPKKNDDQLAIEHVKSFEPTISHYRRKHAPFRKYLPADLSVRKMHNHFLEKYDEPIAYNTYYQIFKTQNISFTRLGNERCESCDEFDIHKKECTCEKYGTYIAHKRRYLKARQQNKHDATKSYDASKPVYSADLQKVILIPRMDQYKRSIFTSRLCYNAMLIML